jgi:hypothetical protein
MKFSELPERNANALLELYQSALNQKRADAQHMLMQTLRALIVGNIGGVALLMTFVVAAAEKGSDLSIFFGPVWTFLTGIGFGAFASFMLFVVATNSFEHTANMLEKFVKDQLDVDDLIGYGFSRRGSIMFVGAGVAATAALISGVVWSSLILLE